MIERRVLITSQTGVARGDAVDRGLHLAAASASEARVPGRAAADLDVAVVRRALPEVAEAADEARRAAGAQADDADAADHEADVGAGHTVAHAADRTDATAVGALRIAGR